MIGMRREYKFDYSKARANRFATRMKGKVAVVLDPDVAQVFGSAASVNRALRAVISSASGRSRSAARARKVS
jgi:hypothetical protein